MEKSLYTIGYEGVTIETFLSALKQEKIKILFDVRAVPLSRKPGFSKNKLAAHLAANDIAYIGLCNLGTPAAGRAGRYRGSCRHRHEASRLSSLFRTYSLRMPPRSDRR